MDDLFDNIHSCDCDSCAENDGDHEDACPACSECRANSEADRDNEFTFKTGQGIY
jgi:hypothetical protein